MPLHPIISRIVRQAYAKGHGALHLEDVDTVRNHYRKNFAPPKGEPGIDYQANHCLLRIHRPKDKQGALPAIIYLRASGYVLGSLDDTDYFCSELAAYCQCVVIAMEPRLSPEFKFPIPVEDCLDGLYYLHDNHQALGIDPRKIALWGDSSGGSYAAVMAQEVKNERLIAQQVLVYPMVDYFNRYPSKDRYGDGYLFDTTLSEWFITNYCRSTDDYAHCRVSPALAKDFTGLPPTLIIGAECDPMRDESIFYYQQLVAAKVPVNAVYFLGVTHGFLWYSQLVDTAQIALKYAADQIMLGFEAPSEVL